MLVVECWYFQVHRLLLVSCLLLSLTTIFLFPSFKLSFLFSFFFVCIYMLLSSEYAMSITIHVVSFSFTIFRPRCLFKCSHLIIASLRILEFSLSVTRGISSYSVFALCRLWFPRNSQWIILSTLACHNLYQVYLLMPLTTHPAFVSIACIVHSIFHISFLTFLLELRSWVLRQKVVTHFYRPLPSGNSCSYMVTGLLSLSSRLHI